MYINNIKESVKRMKILIESIDAAGGINQIDIGILLKLEDLFKEPISKLCFSEKLLEILDDLLEVIHNIEDDESIAYFDLRSGLTSVPRRKCKNKQ